MIQTDVLPGLFLMAPKNNMYSVTHDKCSSIVKGFSQTEQDHYWMQTGKTGVLLEYTCTYIKIIRVFVCESPSASACFTFTVTDKQRARISRGS